MTNEWHNCYDESWQGIIVPEAFAHPAKMARGLTNRIFKHALSESWIKPGDVVVDPFGGIGSTGIIGAAMGLRVVCVELEEKFVSLGKQNFTLHRKAFTVFNHFGHTYQPQIIQGDSRKLSEVAAESRAKRVTGGGSLGQSQRTQGYGSKGNLGNLKAGQVDAVVSSPPFMGCGTGADKESHNRQVITSGTPTHAKNATIGSTDYGETKGQLGNDKGQTFWAAAKQIVSECHKILKPGGHAIWVVKSFVRKGKIVDFPGDWRRLCESQGLKTVCVHHAMLVKETRTNGLFEEIVETKERKSFFRRLAEKKGSPKIDYEVVLCTQKE